MRTVKAWQSLYVSLVQIEDSAFTRLLELVDAARTCTRVCTGPRVSTLEMGIDFSRLARRSLHVLLLYALHESP